MNTTTIKAEIKKLIDKETDVSILEAVCVLLKKASLDPVLKEKLTSRALKANEDIKTGKVFSKEQVIRHTSPPDK